MKLVIKTHKAFTIIEVLFVVVIIAILAVIVFVAINPPKHFAQTRNAQRYSDINAILNAVSQYSVDNQGTFPSGVDTSLKMIGTSATGCNVACGQSLPIASIDTNSGIVRYANAYSLQDSIANELTDIPVIVDSYVFPKKVLPGDTMTIEASITDSLGVSEVKADMGGIEVISLSLVSGTSQDGVWQAKWNVHDTQNKGYITKLTVTSLDGENTSTNIAWSDPVSGGWVSPNSVQTPGGQWTQSTNSIDGNAITYATNTYGGTGWGQYIYFTANTPILSNRLRINADYQTAQVSNVQIDVLKDGIWTNVFLGGDEATWNAKFVEITYPTGNVTQARFRYNYSAGGYYYWLYEFQFYQTSPTIVAPTVITEDAELIQDVYATVHGTVVDDGGEPNAYRFEYGLTSGYGSVTAWQNGAVSGDTISTFINGLQPSTSYHFRFVSQNSIGTVYGDDKIFQTQVPALGNFSPLGFSDPSNTWLNGINAIDGNPATYAGNFHAINATQWSSYLYFSQDPRYTNRISFKARGLSEVDQAEVDILVNGTWINVFSGSFAGMQTVNIDYAQQLVTQVRIRFHATAANNGFYWQLYELSVQKSSENSAESCLDLASLAPKYIEGIPFDPQKGSSEKTYYSIKQVSTHRVVVYSCYPELLENISVER
jgi:prepilin-type N-terminal cleavage/methylation domain-containing protein